MSALFGGGGNKAVLPVNRVSAVTPPQSTDPAMQAAAAAARLAAAQAAGRGSTVASSPAGDTSPALVSKKTLLGVG
jgi:hypothetical protein